MKKKIIPNEINIILRKLLKINRQKSLNKLKTFMLKLPVKNLHYFRKISLISKTFIWLCLIFSAIDGYSQSINSKNNEEEDENQIPSDSLQIPQKDHVSVFLDCNSCDNNFIRQEIYFVDYVRDPQLAKVHLFITTQGTASGGRLYNLSFIGKNEYKGINNSLSYSSIQNNTQDEERQGLNAIIKLGLIPYVAHTSLASQIIVNISGVQVEQVPIEDPWNNWIFEVYGGIDFSKETSVSALDIRYGLSANHVTEDWRIRLRPYFNYNQRSFNRDNKLIKSVLHRNGFDGRIVRSISNHWSVGVFPRVISSTYQNISLGYSVSPAIEYSLLPYKEALSKEITVAYSIGYLHRNYIEETIYGQMDETLANHALEIGVRIRQPWGSVTAQLEGSHFLNDFSKNRVSFYSRLSMRVLKGLSLNFTSEFDYVQDQLSLPKGDISLEDMLLQQKQLATSYGISLSIGISYRFGSIYNNVVNTRL